MESLMKSVKSHTTKRYTVSLDVDPKGKYRVSWVNFANNIANKSNPCDYYTAQIIFDEKLAKLQGH